MDSSISTGTVTLLFTDIEGSTKLLQQLGNKYEKVLEDHHRILRDVISKFEGREIDTVGDGFFITFDKARNAIAAAVDMQKKLLLYSWDSSISVKVRMGIHTGEPNITETGYVGIDIHRAARIGSAGHGGQVLISESTKVLANDELPDGVSIIELGEFHLKDLKKPERIYQLVISELPSEFPPIKSITHKKNNLPSQIIKLIGREKEVEEIKNLLLDEDIRLITLTGPGGTGKTSVAYNVSKSVVDYFDDGVFVVLLASISDPSLAASSIAQALSLTENSSKTILETLIEYLHDKNILLFLDNFEQIVSSAIILSELLESCPKLKLIVTSRIVLHIKNEFEYFVPPLSLPELKEFDNVESLSQFAAVKLFIERAKTVKQDFNVSNENAPAIAEICIKLDGLPLAIELASARIKLFTPQMILSRLGSMLDILKSPLRSLPERHQTLRQAIAWSYDLLPEDEKRIFRWMSVFSGGFILEAIENVFHEMNQIELDIIDGVEALLNKSLLRRIDGDKSEPRFFMLETIREYSYECLPDDEKNLIGQAHANYYLSLAEKAEPNLTKEGMDVWLNKLEAEQHNFRSSLNWAYETGNSEIALRFCGALWRFWIIRGNLVEGFKEIKKILSMSGNQITSQRAKVLNAAGTIMHEISDYKTSLPFLEESLEIYRKLNDKEGVANVLNNISWIDVHLGNLDKAKELCDEALELNRKLNNKRGIAIVKNNLGWGALQQGEFEKASSLSIENEKIMEELGDIRGVGFAKINRGMSELMLGKYEDALALIDKGLRTIEELRDRQLIAWGNNIQTMLYHAKGNYEAAENSINKSIAIMNEIGNKWVIAFELIWLGHLKFDKGDLKSARELLEKSVLLFNENGSKWGRTLSTLFLGYVFLEESNLIKAEDLFKESLRVNVELKSKYGLMQCFQAIGELAIRKNDFSKAAILYGAAEELKKETRYSYAKCEANRIEKNMKLLKENLKEDLFKKGSIISMEEAVALALNNN